MAHITISTSAEEQSKVLAAIKALQGKTVSIAAIAKEANIDQSRARYAVTDLLDAGKIKREATKAFNKNYIRYKYEVM